jgi:hypothetical protein
VLLTALATTLGLAVVAGPAAQAGKPTAPRVEVDRLVITSALASSVGTLPSTAPKNLGFAVVDQTFTVTVRSASGSDTGYTKVDKDLPVTLSVDGAAAFVGTTSKVIPRGGDTVTFPGLTYAAAENITLTATATVNGSLVVRNGTLDVAVAYGAGYRSNANGKVTVGIDQCATTASVPTCVTLLLPKGAAGSVLVSTANCEGIIPAGVDPCRSNGTISARVAQAYVDLAGSGYSLTTPATAIVDCDKSVCGNGGVNDFPLRVDLGNDGTFQNVEACPSKGVIGESQVVFKDLNGNGSYDPPVNNVSIDKKYGHACIDYRQSTKDGAGDVHTYLLFDYDVRMSH